MGGPGVGKTYTAKGLGIYLTSSTGISALNLGPEVRTIHSTLGFREYKDLLYQIQKGAKGKVEKNLLAISAHTGEDATGIGIDEVSMIPGAVIAKLIEAIHTHNNKVAEGKLGERHNQLSLTLIGDPCQLPPPKNEHDPFFMNSYWNAFNVEYLTRVYRQSDIGFLNGLSLIRQGRVREAVDWFISNVKFTRYVDTEFPGYTVFATNEEVDTFNKAKMAELKTPSIFYQKLVENQPNPDWDNIPDKTEIRVGMKVMILVNNFQERYANGDMGIVIEALSGGVLVELLKDGRRVLIPIKEVDNIIIYKDKQGTYQKLRVGRMHYMPLKAAFCSTIHKAQGLTLDQLQVDMRNRFLSRLSGAGYTAITRVRSPEGLVIVGNREQFIKGCYINPMYIDFCRQLELSQLEAA